jgi:tetratricopeptide (TPR) repeat protein
VPPPSGETAASKVEKLIFSTRDRMDAFQKEEFQIQMSTMNAVYAASQGVKDVNKAADQIAKGSLSADLRAYQAAVASAARDWRYFQQRYAGVGRFIKTLEKERPNVPQNLQADIDGLISRYENKNRGLLLKVADLCEKIADWRGALAVLGEVYQDIPENKRGGERALIERIAGLLEKCGDYAGALNLVKGIVEARPEKDRYKDAKLGDRLGRLYEKTGDLKAALDVYKKTYDAIPADKRAKDGANLKKKIAELEKKLNPPPPKQK